MKDDKIIFIERKKKENLVELLRKYYIRYQVSLVSKLYKNEGIIWKVLYDKIYRKDLYNLLMKTENEKDLNFIRNLYYIKSKEYEYAIIKTNESFIEDDLDFYLENNYLYQTIKYYKYETFTYLSCVPILLLSFYSKWYKRDKLFNFNTILFVGILYFSYSFRMKKSNLNNTMDKIIEGSNIKEFEVYKRLFYINYGN